MEPCEMHSWRDDVKSAVEGESLRPLSVCVCVLFSCSWLRDHTKALKTGFFSVLHKRKAAPPPDNMSVNVKQWRDANYYCYSSILIKFDGQKAVRM